MTIYHISLNQKKYFLIPRCEMLYNTGLTEGMAQVAKIIFNATVIERIVNIQWNRYQSGRRNYHC